MSVPPLDHSPSQRPVALRPPASVGPVLVHTVDRVSPKPEERMDLHTAQYLQNTNEQATQYNGGPGWREISRGLRLVALGYCVLVVGSIVGPLLVWLAVTSSVEVDSAADRDARGLALLFAALVFLLTAV